MPPEIELYLLPCVALLVPMPTGVTYTNQTGGFSCNQPSVEGILVPYANDLGLDGKLVGATLPLCAYFEGPKHRGTGATDGLDEEDAATIDAILRAAEPSTSVTVDRAKLADSHEAWVHVLLGGDDWSFRGLGPYPRSAILTWPNSD